MIEYRSSVNDNLYFILEDNKMKTITKIFAVVLALATLMSCMVACGGKDENTLVMATNATFPPYEYKEGDKIVGIDAEIAQALADKLGMKLEIKDIDFGQILTGVETGKYDIGMAGMTVNPDRLKSVDFTTSYAKGVQVVIVPEDSTIKSIDDLLASDCKIGVQQETTGHIYAADTVENGGFGEDRVTAYKNGPDAVQALITGKVGAVIIDREPAKSYVKANQGLTILETAYTEEDYAICVAKENTELLEKLNKALAELTEDGTIERIINKYIPSESTATATPAPATAE